MDISDMPLITPVAADEFRVSSGRPDKVTLELDIEPLAVQSVRFSKFGCYSPANVKKWKKDVAEMARAQFPWDPYDGPLCVHSIQYRFPFPKTLKKATREAIASGVVFHMDRKCDLMDNLNKATMDSLATIIFTDDRNIVKCNGLEKIYSENPGITITFHNLEGKVNTLPK